MRLPVAQCLISIKAGRCGQTMPDPLRTLAHPTLRRLAERDPDGTRQGAVRVSALIGPRSRRDAAWGSRIMKSALNSATSSAPCSPTDNGRFFGPICDRGQSGRLRDSWNSAKYWHSANGGGVSREVPCLSRTVWRNWLGG